MESGQGNVGAQRVDVAVGLRSRESYLERSGVADCVYYMKIGFCGFGSRCRYNHHRARSLISTLRSGRGEYPKRIGEPNIKEVLLRIKMNFSEMSCVPLVISYSVWWCMWYILCSFLCTNTLSWWRITCSLLRYASALTLTIFHALFWLPMYDHFLVSTFNQSIATRISFY